MRATEGRPYKWCNKHLWEGQAPPLRRLFRFRQRFRFRLRLLDGAAGFLNLVIEARERGEGRELRRAVAHRHGRMIRKRGARQIDQIGVVFVFHFRKYASSP